MARPFANLSSMTLTDAKGGLELVCSKCTFAEVFPAPDRREAYMRAALKGWLQRVDTVRHESKAICPRCAR